MSRRQRIARSARETASAAKDYRKWMLGVLPLVLFLAACTDAPTAPPLELAEAPRPSLGVTLAPSGYSVPQPLGFLPGGSFSSANGINNKGHIVGHAKRLVNGVLRNRAFLYIGGSIPLQDLGTFEGHESSAAMDINDAGHIVGTTSGFYTFAFRFSPGLGMEGIHDLDYPKISFGEAINSAGTIVGFTAGSGYQPFRWTSASGMQLLHPTPEEEAEAYDINDDGIIVGKHGYGKALRAYVWSGNSGGASMGTLGGSWSYATAINNNSWIVGTSETATGEYHGFLWTWYWGLQDMGPLGPYYTARDISDKGRIIGHDDVLSKAFTFYQGKFSYLPTLTTGGATVANAVNTCGTIAGRAVDAAGRWVAVRWVRRTCDS